MTSWCSQRGPAEDRCAPRDLPSPDRISELLQRLRDMWDDPFDAVNGPRSLYLHEPEKYAALTNEYRQLAKHDLIFLYSSTTCLTCALPDLRHPTTREILPPLIDNLEEVEELLGFSTSGRSFGSSDDHHARGTGNTPLTLAKHLVGDGYYFVKPEACGAWHAYPHEGHPFVKAFYQHRRNKQEVWEKYHREDYQRQCAEEGARRDRELAAKKRHAIETRCSQIFGPITNLSNAAQIAAAERSLSEDRYPELVRDEEQRHSRRSYERERAILQSRRSAYDSAGSWEQQERDLKERFGV